MHAVGSKLKEEGCSRWWRMFVARLVGGTPRSMALKMKSGGAWEREDLAAVARTWDEKETWASCDPEPSW